MSTLPPEMYPVLITFLIQVGQWAKEELKERWQFKRKASLMTIDLSDADSVRENAPKILEEVTTGKKITEIKQVLDLVEEKRALVYQYKQAKTSTLKDQLLGRIGDDVVQFRLHDFDKKIQTQMYEIAEELKQLGIELDRTDVT